MKLTREILRSRLRDYAMSFYGQMGYANKSGALAVAGVALLSIILTPSHDLLPRFIYWLTGLMMVTVTLVSWTVHPLFVGSARMRIADLMSPVVTGISEYFIFGVLIWTPDYPKLWLWFPFAVAAQGFTSWLLVVNRLGLLRKREDFAPELAPIERMMKNSIVGSFVATSFASVFYTTMGLWTYFDSTQPEANQKTFLIVIVVFVVSLLLLWGFAKTTFDFLRKAEKIVSES
jgi:hypothetical protein